MSYSAKTDYGCKLPINQNPNYLTERSWLINTREDVLNYSKTGQNEQWKRAYENLADALNVIDAFIARSESTTCEKKTILQPNL